MRRIYMSISKIVQKTASRFLTGTLIASIILILMPKGIMAQVSEPPVHPNVVFIMIDDLRPDLNCYGTSIYGDNKLMQTPNIDKFAAGSVLFNNEYAVVPTCGPSRLALLTGILPKKRAALSNEACVSFLSNKPPSDTPRTFIADFKRQGYYTVGIGKISHYPDGYVYPYTAARKSNQLELPYSWNEMLLDAGKWGTGWNAFFGYADGSNRTGRAGAVKPYERGEVGDTGYVDGLTANLAVKTLDRLSEKDKPFFLAVGFFKPHLPFNAPKKYWDMYDEAKIGLTQSPDLPEHINKADLHGSFEFNFYKDGEEHPSLDKPVSGAYARRLRHAYYASVSYIDAQVGKVLDELKRLKLDKNTIVVLWSDHGWHLGDDRVWGKHTLFEYATRSVLIVKTPDMKRGKISRKIVSSVDVYPTLTELCHLPVTNHLDGSSFVPLLKDPGNKKWKDEAYSYYNKGISLRTQRYRLTKYFRRAQPTVELFDHKYDPYENENVAAKHPKLVQRLLAQLEKGNTGLFEAQ